MCNDYQEQELRKNMQIYKVSTSIHAWLERDATNTQKLNADIAKVRTPARYLLSQTGRCAKSRNGNQIWALHKNV